MGEEKEDIEGKKRIFLIEIEGDSFLLYKDKLIEKLKELESELYYCIDNIKITTWGKWNKI